MIVEQDRGGEVRVNERVDQSEQETLYQDPYKQHVEDFYLHRGKLCYAAAKEKKKKRQKTI